MRCRTPLADLLLVFVFALATVSGASAQQRSARQNLQGSRADRTASAQTTSRQTTRSRAAIPASHAGQEQDADRSTKNIKRISGFSPEGIKAAKALGLSKDFQANLFASEPLLANPVAFCIDEKNRFYVCETFRINRGVEDNREHEDWIDDDLAARSIEDRLAFYKKHLGNDMERLTGHQDRVRLLLDRNGDGRADKSSVFIDGFNGPLEGTGAGILARRGTVYYACIPRLWALRDQDGDGRAEKKTVLHEGYGVRVAFIGHDLHGLCLGHDGRLYFSIGDRGFNVQTKSGRLANPETGAVFRCELDGSRLEVFATGLRNPQDLEFDDYGNLFTGDNNSDSGDLARWLHIIQDADYGWRMAYQYLPDRGPWNRERMWEMWHAEQPAFSMPPVANFADGPSGITYYPGTGMSTSYRGNFFLCDFRGEARLSGVRTFKMKTKGASFELIDPELFVWNCLPTDVQFGTDGAMYITDWVEGWNGTGKGRIFRITHEKGSESKGAQEVQEIMAQGLGEATSKQLARLLAHPDRRLRREAQFQLTSDLDVKTLAQVAHTSKIQLARLHAIWGLGQIGRIADKQRRDLALEEITPLVNDIDEEVRFTATMALGDCRFEGATERLIRGLNDPNLRVRYASAQSLSRLQTPEAVEPLISMLVKNNDRDPTLRHGGAMALVGCAKPRQLRQLAKHPSRAVRMAAVLALRRLESPSLAIFLDDQEELIVTEAARAIHDLPVPDALPALANMITKDLGSAALARRVLSANFRLGGKKRAQALAEFAADDARPIMIRVDALALLAKWDDPPSRDFVTGLWRPVQGTRNAKDVATALESQLTELLDSPHDIRLATARLAARLKIEASVEYLERTVWDESRDGEERAGSLLALSTMSVENFRETIDKAIEDDSQRVRAAGRLILAQLDEEAAIEPLWEAIRNGTQLERQSAIEVLAKAKTPAAEKKMLAVMNALLGDQVPDTVRLDIYEAARATMGDSEELKKMVIDYEEAWDKKDPLAPYRDMLAGGDAERGKRLFFEHTALQCTKCHKLDGRGSEMGPDISTVGASKTREYLIESLVLPNETIAEGYETVILELDDGRVVSGIVQKKTKTKVYLVTADGELLTVDIDSIEDESRGKSAMPDNLINQITPFQVRDLVEYLSSLKRS